MFELWDFKFGVCLILPSYREIVYDKVCLATKCLVDAQRSLGVDF